MDLGAVFGSSGLLLNGLLLTVYLSAITIVSSTVLGAVVGFARASRVPIISWILKIYVETFRGTPLLVQLLFIYFGAAYIGMSWVTTFIGAVVGLTLYEGAICSEIFRAGVEAVPPAQHEAAHVLGISKWDSAVRIIMPQALRVTMPALIGQEISLVKDTSLAAVIGFAELVNQSQAVIGNINQPMLVLTVVGALYFIICYPMSVGARRLERKAAR
jgi:polar amino acid transport system permease protein